MNKYITSIAIIAATALISCKSSKEATPNAAASQATQPAIQDGAISNTTLIIMYDAKVGKEPLLKAAKEYGAEVIYQYENISGIALRIPEGGNITEAIKYFKAVEGVLTVNRDRTWRLM